MTRTRLYRGGVLAATDFPLAQVAEYARPQDAAVWVDLRTPTDEQLAMLGEELACTISRSRRPAGTGTTGPRAWCGCAATCCPCAMW